MSVTGMRSEDAESESLPLGFTCDVALGAVTEVPQPCSIEGTQRQRGNDQFVSVITNTSEDGHDATAETQS